MARRQGGPNKRSAPSSPATRTPARKPAATKQPAEAQAGETKAGGARKRPARPGEGRPTKFDPEMLARVTRLCLLGLTDKQLAAALEISEATLNLWKAQHPEFSESMQAGKVDADAKVAAALYQRATGYEVEVEELVGRGKDRRVVKLKQYVASDASAAFRWLNCRQPNRWRDRQEHEHGISDDLAQALGLVDGRTKALAGALNGAAARDEPGA